MENSIYYLNSTGPKSDLKRQLFFGIAGAIYIALGIINILYPVSSSSLFLIVGGVLILGYSIIYRKVIKRCYISVNDNGIKSRIADKIGKFPTYEELEIKWEEIEALTIDSLIVRFQLKNGNTKEMKLGDLLYKQHQLFKQNLQKYVDLKNIKIA